MILQISIISIKLRFLCTALYRQIWQYPTHKHIGMMVDMIISVQETAYLLLIGTKIFNL